MANKRIDKPSAQSSAEANKGSQLPDAHDPVYPDLEDVEFDESNLPSLEENFTPVESNGESAEPSEAEPIFEAGEVSDGELDATRLYLAEIGFSPLLTAEQEVEYSRAARAGDETSRTKMIDL